MVFHKKTPFLFQLSCMGINLQFLPNVAEEIQIQIISTKCGR